MAIGQNKYIGYGKALGLCLLLFLASVMGEGQRRERNRLSRKTAIVLDNPKNDTITCNIDGKDYTVAAKGRCYLQLANGEHYMVYDGDTITFVKGARDGGSILNPTGSTYVVWSRLHSDKKYICFLWNGQRIEGDYYEGPYLPLAQRYIQRPNGKPEGTWYWGLDDKMPMGVLKRLPFMKKGKEYWLGKIYRYEDFKREVHHP